MSKPDDLMFDSRIRDRLLRNQTLSSAQVQSHLDALPDLEGEYELMREVPQPAVTPPRSESTEEPIVFDGIRRLQALAGVAGSSSASAASASSSLDHRSYGTSPSHAGTAPASGVVSSGVPSLQSALSGSMDSEISGVGAGAVSAALGAMAAEAAGVSRYGLGAPPPAAPPRAEPPAAPMPEPPSTPLHLGMSSFQEPEPPTPVTLRSEPDASTASVAGDVAAEALDDDIDDDDIDDDDVDDDDDDLSGDPSEEEPE
jgi:hypothetical protein